jgi:polyisoprenoid-binding protein YceI
MRHFLTLAAAGYMLFTPLQVSAQTTPLSEMPAGTYKLDLAHASLVWKVSHLGLSNYTARFTDFDATLELDPADPTQSKLTVTVDPTSVETAYPNANEKDFDAKLATGDDWFNGDEFPKIEFESTSIELTGDNTGTVTGNLLFLGQSQPITLDVTFNGAYASMPFSDKPGLGFSATATMDRTNWGFNTYVPNIGAKVDLLIEAEFQKAE